MTSAKGKPRYIPVPGDNTTRWLFLGALSTDRRRRLTHMMVCWHILEAWWDKFGNCRAGVTFLQNGTGLTRGAIATATSELVEWGYFTRRMGEGKRPTEYFPKWSIVLQPSDVNPSVLQLRDPWVLPSQDAKFGSVLQPSDQTHLLSPLTAGLTYSVNDNTHGAALPPLSAGLAATDAETPRDPENGFEQFWKAFPRKHYRTAAEAAWGKIAPDAELLETIIGAAEALANHYAANPIEKKWMRTAPKWLAGKGWTEDLPSVYADPRDAAIAKAKDRPKKDKPASVAQVEADNDNKDNLDAPGEWIGDVGVFSPFGRFGAEIAGSKVHWRDEHNEQVVLTLRLNPSGGIASGVEVEHTFLSQSADEQKQKRGQAFLNRIAFCLGIEHDLEDTDVFHGRTLSCYISNRGEISYMPTMQIAA